MVIMKICKKCKKNFRAKDNTRVYCSMICRNEALKGRKLSIETKEKMSNIKKGKPPNHIWEKGHPLYTGRREKHYNWKGGISKRILCTKEYSQWRSDVFQRDNWTCQTCRKRGGPLEAHHIKEVCNYPELMLDVNNGVTLCYECHRLTKRGSKTIQKDKVVIG